MTKRDDGLSPRQRRFVAAMVTARTVEEAAAAVRVTERTGRRYLAEPAVKRALAAALDQALGEVIRRGVDEMGAALDTLAEVHRDPEAPPSSRVSAARVIWTETPKLREALDLAERVAALEEQQERGSK